MNYIQLSLFKGCGSGRDIALNILDSIKNNGLENHKFAAMVFDTTAKNSGKLKGAAKILEALLDTKMLYLGCNHHVLEIALNANWVNLFGETKSPDNAECKQFKEAWKELDLNMVVDILPDMTDEAFLSFKESFIKIMTSILEDPDTRDNLPRDDYRECAELASSC